MTLKDIQMMGAEELSRLSFSEMKAITKQLQNAINRRVRNISATGEYSAGVEILVDSGGLITTLGKNRNQLYHEVARGLDFLSKQTSTVKGTIAVRKERELRMFGETREEAGIPFEEAEERLREKYKQYREWEESHRDIISHAGSPETFNKFSKMVQEDKYTPEELTEELYKYGETFKI